MIRVTVTAVVALLAVAPARIATPLRDVCAASNTAQHGRSVASGHLFVQIELGKQKYKLGENIAGIVTFRNTSKKPTSILYPGFGSEGSLSHIRTSAKVGPDGRERFRCHVSQSTAATSFELDLVSTPLGDATEEFEAIEMVLPERLVQDSVLVTAEIPPGGKAGFDFAITQSPVAIFPYLDTNPPQVLPGTYGIQLTYQATSDDYWIGKTRSRRATFELLPAEQL